MALVVLDGFGSAGPVQVLRAQALEASAKLSSAISTEIEFTTLTQSVTLRGDFEFARTR